MSAAIVLKLTWDITQTQQTFNMSSTPAAHHFKNALEQSQERCKAWEELPVERKLAFEQKCVFGLRSLPPIENSGRTYALRPVTDSTPVWISYSIFRSSSSQTR
eukprot:1527779-Amphidinium_carterae.1